jgi:DNA-binding transcriptional LysR family regulator
MFGAFGWRIAGRFDRARPVSLTKWDTIRDAVEVSYGSSKIDIVIDMTIDLKHLRYFLAVAEERHITRAAEKLGMQQPPLSQRIKEIERQLDVQLFRRKPRGVDLTEAGRVLLDNARTMLAHHERALQSTRRAARGEQGELSVGLMPTAFFHPFVPSVIRDFRKHFPGVSVSLDECLRAEAFERIQNERMDVAFMRIAEQPLEGLVIYPLLAEPMILAVPAAHELAQRDRGKSLSLRQAARATFIVYARQHGPTFFEATMAACRRAGFSPQVGQEAPLAVSALNLVSAGLGIAVVPQSMRRMGLDGVVYRDLRGEVPKARLSIAARRNDPSNVVRNFLSMVRRRAKEANAQLAI